MHRLLHCPWCGQLVLALVDVDLGDCMFRVHRVDPGKAELCKLGLRSVPLSDLKELAA